MTSQKIIELIRAMVQNQSTLNTTAYSNTWLEKAASGEWNYLVAASQEIAEFTNSFWLPWWSKAEQDMANCRIELVDATHFMLSAAIAAFDGDIEQAAKFVTESYADAMEVLQDMKDEGAPIDALAIMQILQCEINGGDEGAFGSLFALCEAIDFDLEKLYALYMGKSTLNKFRQDNGYKQGTYKKKWDGVHEDNYFLSQWVGAQTTPPTVEQVREFLETEYAKHK